MLVDRGLYHYNTDNFDEEFSDNFMDFTLTFSNVFYEIGKKYHLLETSDDDLLVFASYIQMSFIVSHLEAIKGLLKLVVNPKLLERGIGDGTTLGQMITGICKKLECDKKTWKAHEDLFYVKFRNAIAHQNYHLSKDGLTIFPKDETQKRTFRSVDLIEVAQDVAGIFNGLTEFTIRKLKRTGDKADKIDKIAEELLKRNEELDRKTHGFS